MSEGLRRASITGPQNDSSTVSSSLAVKCDSPTCLRQAEIPQIKRRSELQIETVEAMNARARRMAQSASPVAVRAAVVGALPNRDDSLRRLRMLDSLSIVPEDEYNSLDSITTYVLTQTERSLAQ